uniref:APS kinase n=1 Tax=Rhabditophanes sp. KR3021 TaxID=114890 RepID=A0AC35U364_9BILA
MLRTDTTSFKPLNGYQIQKTVEAYWPVKKAKVEDTMDSSSTNVTFQQHKTQRDDRGSALGKFSGHRGCTVWLTGLSGAGKTTIAFAVEKILTKLGVPSYALDGDNVRHGLCKNLGFKPEDRTENIRRVSEVSKMFADMGIVTLASFISPYQADRDEARRIHESDNLSFFEVYVNTSLDVCESRDSKNLYKMARDGKLKGFTGIDSEYEVPTNPDMIVNANSDTEAECVEKVLQFLFEKEVLPKECFGDVFGAVTKELFITSEKTALGLKTMSKNMKRLDLDLTSLQWLQVLSEGWATPLNGFMRERQYLQSLHFGQIFDLKKDCEGEFSDKPSHSSSTLPSPVSQSIPIVLPIDDNKKEELISSKDIALYYKDKLIAILSDIEIFPHQKEERISRQFGFTDSRHPTISLIRSQGDWCVGGDLQVFEKINYNDGLDEYRLTPNQLKEIFVEKKCDSVFAFQLRNPIHNGHALLMKDTREKLLSTAKNPMLLLHPLGGWTKDDDVLLHVRIEQHKAVIEEGILDKSWTVLAIFPSPMLYAGPTEVQWHAKARLAAGVNAYIVGRDPAGIAHPDTGDYLYDPSHGAKVLTMTPGLSNLNVIPFKIAAYDTKAKAMSYFDSQRKDDFIFISGTKMRNYAKTGVEPPSGFMAPSAWNVLKDYYEKLNQA